MNLVIHHNPPVKGNVKSARTGATMRHGACGSSAGFHRKRERDQRAGRHSPLGARVGPSSGKQIVDFGTDPTPTNVPGEGVNQTDRSQGSTMLTPNATKSRTLRVAIDAPRDM